MALRLFTDNAGTTLSAGIISTDLSLTVPIGDVSRFPTISGLDYFVVTITQAGVETSWEKVKVTAVASNVFTIVRGFDGSTPADWSAGAKVELRDTAIAIQNGANALVPDSSGNIYANVIPRTGTLSSLLSLAGTQGELASATDVPAIVQFTGTPGAASAFYSSQSGLVLYNNTATNGSTINANGYSELIVAANISTTLTVTLPQNPSSGQKFLFRNMGTNTAYYTLTLNKLPGSSPVTLPSNIIPFTNASSIELEYISATNSWVVHSFTSPNNKFYAASNYYTIGSITSTSLTNSTIANIGNIVITPDSENQSYIITANLFFTLGAGAILSFAEITTSNTSGVIDNSITAPVVTITGLPTTTTSIYSAQVSNTKVAMGMGLSTTYVNVRAFFTGGTVTVDGSCRAIRVL